MIPPPAAPAGEALPPEVLRLVMDGYRLGLGGIHGPGHWRRVRLNGLLLAQRTAGADHLVVAHFALLHDSRRIDDDEDPGHGRRAAVLVRKLAATGLLPLDPTQVALLAEACTHHAGGAVSDDPTIGCCWDADRLDLSRLAIRPRDSLLSTAAARDPTIQSEAWTRGRAGTLVPAGPGWPTPPARRAAPG